MHFTAEDFVFAVKELQASSQGTLGDFHWELAWQTPWTSGEAQPYLACEGHPREQPTRSLPALAPEPTSAADDADAQLSVHVHLYDYHIMYSDTYLDLVLLIRGKDLDGRPLNFHEVLTDHPHLPAGMDPQTNMAPSPHPLMPGPWVAVHTCQAAPLLAALQRQQGQWPASTPQQGMEATMPEELDGLRVVQDAFDRPPSAATDTGGSDNTFCEGFAAAVAASVGDVAVCLSGPVRSCERQDVDEESSVGFPPALMYLRLWYNLTCRRLLSG